MNKPTPGPWICGGTGTVIRDCSSHAIARVIYRPDCTEQRNSDLIVAAVNACFAINPDNPLAVAEALGECLAALKAVYLIYDGLLDTDAPLDCPEVQAVLRARAALAKLEAKP